MQLMTTGGALARLLLAGLVLIALFSVMASAIGPSGEDLVNTVLWIVALGVAVAGIAAAVMGKRPLVGVGSLLVASGALLAFYWKPMPSSIVWPILFLGGTLLIAYGARDDSRHRGSWPIVLVRIAIGWGWFDNAQDHLRGAAQSVWVPGGGGFLTAAKNAAADEVRHQPLSQPSPMPA